MINMSKKEMFSILSQADGAEITGLAAKIAGAHKVETLKKPEKNLVMLKVRESARSTLFYAAEALACECMVALDGVKGFASCLGDDMEKIYAMAVIDAAVNAGAPETVEILDMLWKWGADIKAARAREAALTMSTKVNFTVMEE